MNAPATIPAKQRSMQSLRSLCDNRRLKLLQDFARIEIALSELHSGTFSQALGTWVDADPSRRRKFEKLPDIRNLVAHALVEIVDLEGAEVAIWRMAQSRKALNARSMDSNQLERWFQSAQELQHEALAELA